MPPDCCCRDYCHQDYRLHSKKKTKVLAKLIYFQLCLERKIKERKTSAELVKIRERICLHDWVNISFVFLKKSYSDASIKSSWNMHFQRAYIACVYVFKLFKLIWANQTNNFKNATANARWKRIVESVPVWNSIPAKVRIYFNITLCNKYDKNNLDKHLSNTCNFDLLLYMYFCIFPENITQLPYGQIAVSTRCKFSSSVVSTFGFIVYSLLGF